MKYRNLTFQELSVMEDDFSEYLYSKGFNRYEWNFFQDYAPIQAFNLIGQYSEQTFEKVMQNVNYLAFRNTNHIISYRFKESELVKITLKSLEKTQLDFTKDISIQSIDSYPTLGLKYLKETKSYKRDRQRTIFELIESGYIATDDKLHKSLNNLRNTALN